MARARSNSSSGTEGQVSAARNSNPPERAACPHPRRALTGNEKLTVKADAQQGWHREQGTVWVPDEKLTTPGSGGGAGGLPWASQGAPGKTVLPPRPAYFYE